MPPKNKKRPKLVQIGLRLSPHELAMVKLDCAAISAKYVATEFGGGTNLWWYPYGIEFQRLMSTANRSLHAPTFARRLRDLVALVGFRRFWQRVRVGGILRHIDKLF